jgi:hypothetical protein
MMTMRAALVAAGLAMCASAALADDWTAVQLRGQVLELVGKTWQPLARGASVADGHTVQTMGTGHVVFVRGAEKLDLGPNTKIQIFDRGGVKPFTTVQQYFGTVSVEAQVENVRHFAVQTQYLAAVVKGTRFTVTADASGASVSVQRGHVEVEDKHDKSHVTITVRQSARIDKVQTAGSIALAGPGKLPPVLDKHGKPLPPTAGPKGPKGGPKAPKPPKAKGPGAGPGGGPANGPGPAPKPPKVPKEPKPPKP